MRDKLYRVFLYSSPEIYAVLVITLVLLASDLKIRLSTAAQLLKEFRPHPVKPVAANRVFRPLLNLKKTRVASFVEAIDKNLGWKPSCLRRTLALASIFQKMGFAPAIKIGVHRDEEILKAHSWIEIDGMRLEMQDDGIAYTPLMSGTPL